MYVSSYIGKNNMRLYNTLTGAIEEFKVDRNTVNMYVC